MKNRIFIIGLLLVLVVVLIWFMRKDEDGWICVDNVWQKHGNPTDTAPASGCGENAPVAVGNSHSATVPEVEENQATTMNVKVYFPNTSTDPNFADCTRVLPVQRVVAATPRIGRAALQELFNGPNASELAAGYFTSINAGVEILDLNIVNGIATVNLSAALQKGVGGSCRVATIRSQIENTLKQFPTVQSVIIQVEGDSASALQP